MREWLAQNWGNVASVLGVILSAWAAAASTFAKRAADDAKKAVELRSLAGALKTCGDEVSSLSLHFDSHGWRLAETVVGRTLRELSYIVSRWHGHLDEQSTASCALISAQLETMQSELRKFRTRAPRDAETRNLYKTVSRLESLLATEVGKSESKLEVVAASPKRS